MAASPDHPDIQFVQAAGYTPGRPYGPPIWVVVHDMEASETPTRAEDTARYFANPGDGRNVSSHYCADSNSVVQCVRLKDSAWTVGNKPGNYLGINWELSGFASQTRAQWLDAFGYAMFAVMAPIVRADMAEYGIPLRRCTIADLQARRPGITSHNDLRVAFGGTTHTDPGANFPWDVFLDTLAGNQPVTGGDPVQMLIKNNDDGTFWLADGMLRRTVPVEWLGNLTNPQGPITNIQVHQAGLLGNLRTGPGGNSTPGQWMPNGQIFVTAGDMDVWGVDVNEPSDGGGLPAHDHPVDAELHTRTGPANPV